MNIRRLFSLFVLFIVFACMLNAQYDVQKVDRFLSKEDRFKIEKANSFLNQGNEILFANYSTGEIDSLFQEMPNYIELSKNMYVGKRISRLLYDTNDYYKTGFESKVEVYYVYISNYINHGIGLFNTEVEGLNDSISNLLRDARLERNKSKAVGNLSKGGSLIHSSNQNYQKAVLFAQDALAYISKNKQNDTNLISSDSIRTQEFPLEVEIAVDNEVSQPKKEKVVASASVVESTEREEQMPAQVSPIVLENESTIEIKKEIVVEETKQVPKDEVYYTVQIMADRKAVNESRVRLVYKGKHPIIENQGDGWYRYSFGKFFTLNEAKRALTISKTKGYVVAYKNKDRISLSEANTWFLSNGN